MTFTSTVAQFLGLSQHAAQGAMKQYTMAAPKLTHHATNMRKRNHKKERQHFLHSHFPQQPPLDFFFFFSLAISRVFSIAGSLVCIYRLLMY